MKYELHTVVVAILNKNKVHTAEQVKSTFPGAGTRTVCVRRYLELGLGATAELSGDGEQRLVDAGLRQLVAVALPALLQPPQAPLAHGQQGQGHGQVAPLPLRPGREGGRGLKVRL